MRVQLLLTLAGPLLAFGQIHDLATVRDGSVVYFSTPLRQKGTAQSLYDKLFAIDATGLRLVVARDPGDPAGNSTTNYYQIKHSEVSDDGSVIAYTASRPCYGGSSCIPVEVNQANVGALHEGGRVTISRNGRYALIYGTNPFAGSRGSSLYDLTTGVKSMILDPIVGMVNGVLSADGTILGQSFERTFTLRSGTSVKMVTVSEPAFQANDFAHFELNDTGTRFVYFTSTQRLVAYDIASTSETVLATGVAPKPFTISSDGQHVAYLRAAGDKLQAFLDDRQLTAVPDGITEVTLSSDASIAYAATGEGRLLKIATTAGTIDEQIPRTPQVVSTPGGTAPGSAVLLTGSALQSAAVFLNGMAARLLSVAPDQLWFYVPFDTPLGAAAIRVDTGTSPFETGPDSITLTPFAPQFIGMPNLVAAHQDFLSLVTADSPARAGEVIHLWMTGLGAVDTNSPPRIVAPFNCRLWDGGPNDAQVLYAGAAPGLTGFYQVDLLIPAGLRLSSVTAECGSGPASLLAFGSLAVIAGSGGGL